MSTTQFEGNNCTVELDTDQRTVTLYHSGWTTPAAKKKASPRVIPFDAIESVEYTKKLVGGDLRIVRRDRDGYHKSVVSDLNGFLESSTPAAEFANLIREAAGLPTVPLTDRELKAAGLPPAQGSPTSTRSRPATSSVQRANSSLLAKGDVEPLKKVYLYEDGTFHVGKNPPERLLGFVSETDSMRRKSVTGRGAAFVLTGGLSMAASNNRGVIYVSITGDRTGVTTYTTRNPSNLQLESIRSLQAAADVIMRNNAALAATPSPAPTAAPAQPTDVAGQLATLSQLHASGALSDAEFESAKARILS